MTSAELVLAILNSILNTLQVIALAYIAARYGVARHRANHSQNDH